MYKLIFKFIFLSTFAGLLMIDSSAPLLASSELPFYESAGEKPQEIPMLALHAGQDAPHLSGFVRYSKRYNGDLALAGSSEHAWQSVVGRSIQFGRAAPNIVILLRVKNSSDTAGEWVFSTDRGSATSLQIYHLGNEGLQLRFDSDNFENAKQVLHSYLHYADPLALEPGEEKLIIVRSDVEDSAYFPLTLQARKNYFADSHLSMMLAAGCTAAILALLVLNLFFYLATGRPEFVWLVAAEFFLACVIMYLVGFFSTYLFFDRPAWMLVVGDLVKYGYVVCMAQFARVFVNTRDNLPKSDIFLRGLIGFSLVMVVVQCFSAFIPLSIRIQLHALNYLIVATTTFYFVYIGIYATRKLGSENWPLIVAWGVLAGFAVYAALAFSGAVANLPMSFYAIAPVGVIEAAFATLAIGLNIRKNQHEYVQTKEAYLQSLEEKLEISLSAQQLAEEKASALATVVDQSALLHASGHDSQQVLLALNSALDAVKHSNGELRAKDISGIIQSSADYLDKIVSTTMSGARLAGVGDTTIALSRFGVDELLQPIAKMYQGLFIKKGLDFTIDSAVGIQLVSDRAILTRVLSNVVSNSLKFTDRGSVSVMAFEHQSQLVIQVRDSGCGVDAAAVTALNSLGDERVRTSEQVEGTGSGFRYSQRVLRKLGGQIEIQAQENGALVELRLPQFGQHTACDIAELLSANRADDKVLEVVDWDALSHLQRQNELQALRGSRAVITFDDSAALRQELNDAFSLIIYKPLTQSLVNAAGRLSD